MPLSNERVTSKEVMELLDGLQSADGIYCVDHGQRIIYWSRSAQQVLGYTAREMLGRPCYEVLATRDSQNHRFCRPDCPVMTNARRGRLTYDYDVLAQRKDGADIWVNISILLVRVKKRRSPLVVHLIRDVTERRRVEGLARRAVDSLRSTRRTS